MWAWKRLSQAFFGTAVLGGTLLGCAAQHDDALRLSEELGRARADAAAQHALAAELESRLSRLERRQALSEPRPNERELLLRLDRLIELNAKLVAERAAPPTPTPITNSVEAPAASDEQQLRALVERMRGRPGRPHGGLSREQEAALRVLTQPERKLDTEQLLPASFY